MGRKILLIRPENIFDYNNYPPLNLISLATVLKSKKYEVKIINCASETNPLETIAKELNDTLFVGITMLTSEVPDAYRIMKFVKEKSRVPVVVGGWHCTLFPEQMAECEYIDYVITGEGEEHILTIADAIANQISLPDKILSRKILNMETFPEPDYATYEGLESFINNFLTDKLAEYVKKPMRWLPYESSRGCPSQCTFCINVVTNNTHYRKKSAEKVVNEIERIVNTHRLTHVKIIDDNFFVDINRVRQICEGLVKRNVNFTWDAECRCDYFKSSMINDELLALAKKSGLVQLTIGIESGSLKTLAIMKKGITPEQAEFAVKKCNDYGIVTRPSFIVEIPGETMEDIKKTITFVKHLRKYPYFTCGVQTFRPYPKCELTQQLVKDGKFSEPQKLTEWMDHDVVKTFTSAQYIRPWQVNGKYSEIAAYYLTMESGVSLGRHMMRTALDRFKLKCFITIAKIRNRFNFYLFPVDRVLYTRFFRSFYNKTKAR
ncbi:MAG: radical SAM protein [Candidatus Omnitrophica bacterium]|nr:radical SAM protein [Candidatus Omnitrophota bacterium]